MKRIIHALTEATQGGLGLTSDWADFEMQAMSAFLETVAAQVRRVAGRRGKAEVRVSRGAGWVEYGGTDRSDEPLDWHGYITPGNNNQVLVYSRAESPRRGVQEKERRLSIGDTTPKVLADDFAEAFGA